MAFMRMIGRLLLGLGLAVGVWAQNAVKTGPDVGAKVPDFDLTDQNGALHSLRSIMGPKGAMLVFFRSADW
jgi:hypothetical protein